MKKSFWVISLMVFLAVSVAGCATTGDLEKMQAQDKVINQKADQALQEAQEAKASAAQSKAELEKANASAKSAADAAARAEAALKAAEEKAAVAEQRASAAEEKAESKATFEKSMRK